MVGGGVTARGSAFARALSWPTSCRREIARGLHVPRRLFADGELQIRAAARKSDPGIGEVHDEGRVADELHLLWGGRGEFIDPVLAARAEIAFSGSGCSSAWGPGEARTTMPTFQTLNLRRAAIAVRTSDSSRRCGSAPSSENFHPTGSRGLGVRDPVGRKMQNAQTKEMQMSEDSNVPNWIRNASRVDRPEIDVWYRPEDGAIDGVLIWRVQAGRRRGPAAGLLGPLRVARPASNQWRDRTSARRWSTSSS